MPFKTLGVSGTKRTAFPILKKKMLKRTDKILLSVKTILNTV